MRYILGQYDTDVDGILRKNNIKMVPDDSFCVIDITEEQANSLSQENPNLIIYAQLEMYNLEI